MDRFIRCRVFGLLLFLGSVRLVNAGEAFQLFTTSVAIPERGPVVGYTLAVGDYKFSFLPPPGWSVEGNAEKKAVYFASRDLGTLLQIRVVPKKPDEELKKTAAEFRGIVTNRFAQSTIVKEYECFTGGQKGTVFDIQTVLAANAAISTRLAFVPYDGGTIEFELKTQPEKLDTYQFTFNCLLTSFRLDSANGKPIAAAYPDRPPPRPRPADTEQ